MQVWKTIFSVILVVWSVLPTGHFQASSERKRNVQTNRVHEFGKSNEGRSTNDMRETRDQEPLSNDHRSRRKRAAATAAEQSEILLVHNIFRQKEGASDMYHLRWNGVLARMAQTWATACHFVHGQPSADTSSLGYQSIGQNLFASRGLPLNLTSVVQSWFGEKQDYNYKNNSCAPNKACGHYTQIVWSTTYEIGCGYTTCPPLSRSNFLQGIFVVCNYGPGGNELGTKPYQIGTACSKCSSGQFYCNNGLCDIAGRPPPCVTTTPRTTYTTVSTPKQQNISKVPSGLGNAYPPTRACLCVQSANISVQSTYGLRSSMLRLANKGECFCYQGVIAISGGRRWYNVNASPGESTVSGWIDGQYLTQAWCPTSIGATCSNPNQRFNNSLATCCLEAGLVRRFSSGGCTDPKRPECTSLSNIRCKCLEELTVFRRDSQATTRIVEGTEVGGDKNHTSGYMLSLNSSKAVINYVTKWFAPAGIRTSDGAKQWKSPRGNIWIRRAWAWDVYCP